MIFSRSASAAGQLFYILGEGLRTELQSFHHGQVREQLACQVRHGHTVADSQCSGLNNFTAFCRQDMSARQASRIFFCYQFDETTGVVISQRTRHILKTQCAAEGNDALLFCLRFGEANGRHLRRG